MAGILGLSARSVHVNLANITTELPAPRSRYFSANDLITLFACGPGTRTGCMGIGRTAQVVLSFFCSRQRRVVVLCGASIGGNIDHERHVPAVLGETDVLPVDAHRT